mmetsp:Transcript_685/g.2507  ORF Transcript_685/g.2507 Transcript_685/m.2507 type:complete len:402 (+) Transcript_685:197-1402(+)
MELCRGNELDDFRVQQRHAHAAAPPPDLLAEEEDLEGLMEPTAAEEEATAMMLMEEQDPRSLRAHVGARPHAATRVDYAASLLRAQVATMWASEFCAARELGQQVRHLRYRPYLVRWLIGMCEDYGFGATTANLSVCYLDRVLSTKRVPRTSLQLVGLAAVLIAAKFEEREARVPKLEDLVECAQGAYSLTSVRRMEVAVLHCLDWRLSHVTCAHFLEYFLATLIHRADATGQETINGAAWTERNLQFFSSFAGYFHSLCLQDWTLSCSQAPSLVAAGILAAAREHLNVAPLWPPMLEKLTRYSEGEVREVMNTVLRLFEEASQADSDEEMAENDTSAVAPATPEGGHGTPVARASHDGSGAAAAAEATKFAIRSLESSEPSPKGPLEAWSEQRFRLNDNQ